MTRNRLLVALVGSVNRHGNRRIVLHGGDQRYSFGLEGRIGGDIAVRGFAALAGVYKIARLVPGVRGFAIREPFGLGRRAGQEKIVDDVAFPDRLRVGADQAAARTPVVDHVADVLAVGLILGIAAFVIDEKIMMGRYVPRSIEQKAESLRRYALADDAMLHRDVG